MLEWTSYVKPWNTALITRTDCRTLSSLRQYGIHLWVYKSIFEKLRKFFWAELTVEDVVKECDSIISPHGRKPDVHLAI